MIKILHTADLHLGKSFSGLERTKSDIRKKELRQTLSRIIELAKAEDVDAVLIAGDLFDSNEAASDLNFAKSLFAELGNICVFIASGNHDWDAYTNTCFSDNVHVFSNSLSYVTVGDVQIFGASFKSTNQSETLLKEIPDSDDCKILVMHGDVQSGEYNPMSIQALKQFDYCALGHIHVYSGIKKDGMTTYAYVGFPEPTGFDDIGSGGVLIGTVGKGFSDIKRVQLSCREYITLEIDASSCKDNLDIVDTLQNEISTENLYKIQLNNIPSNLDISVEYIISCLQNFCFYIEVVQKKQYNYQSIANTPSIKGAFTLKMLEYIKDTDNASLYQHALELGIRAMEENEVTGYDKENRD